MALSLRFHAHSEVGQVRKNNQDAGYASPTLLLVADGMGGAAAGDLASAVVARQASEGDQRVVGQDMLAHLDELLTSANSRLRELIDEDATLDGMGTTFSGAQFDGESFALAHIGDSRCYRLREGELLQLTHDHSWVQSLIDEGRITKEQAATHPHRSLILKVLNGQPTHEPDYELVPAEVGDRLLLCSDGLSGLIDDSQIAELMARDEPLQQIVEQLTVAANEAGGHDNITAVLAEVVPSDEKLDALPGVLVGSALERQLPNDTATQPAITENSSPEDHDLDEQARYAPQDGPRRWPSVVAVVAITVALLFGVGWGSLAYAQSRYFVAAAHEQVGIYNGLPGSLFGRNLHSLVELRPTRVADLPKFYQETLGNTIGSSSLANARQTADELEALAQTCIEAREEHATSAPTPTPRPTPSGLSSEPVDYPTYLAPITPSITSEADPEACR